MTVQASRPHNQRLAWQSRAPLLLGLAVVALLALILFAGGGYEIRAQFPSSGQLVEGGEVQLAGRTVGSIAGVELTDDGLAEVTLEVTDDDLAPLHEGTRAQIRAVGPAGIANRYVNLLPGSRSAAELPEGAVLPLEQTDGIVELDALLAVFDEDVRDDVGKLITGSAGAFAGSADRDWSSMLAKLDPALAEVQGLFEELSSDQARLARLIEQGERAATAIASRRPDLVSAVQTSAEWMGALAAEREHLAGALAGAPDALASAERTLAKAERAVRELRPALPDLARSGEPLADLLERVERTLPEAEPVVRDLRGQLPSIEATLERARTLEDPLVDAFGQIGPAFVELRPILEAFRLYSVDFALGVVNGLAGIVGGNFNGQGHYLHANFAQSPQTIFTSPIGDLLAAQDLVPGVFGSRVGGTETCPGGLVPPAPDGSSPIHHRPDLCDPADSLPLAVNSPPELQP